MELYSKEQPIGLISSMIKRERLCHSFILTGDSGVGKRTAAYYMAMQMLCQNGSGLPCGECKSCLMAKSNAHPDIITVNPTGKSGNYKVEDLRPITADAAIAPNEGKYKVYIIPEIDKALAAAQNLLLKIFEEPPEHVIFIMTAGSKDGVLPTILSRAVVINIPLATEESVLSALENAGHSAARAEEAYSVCGGNIGLCLEYLSGRGFEILDKVKAVAGAIAGCDEYLLDRLLSEAAPDKEEILKLLGELAELTASACAVKKGGIPAGKYKAEAQKIADTIRLNGLIKIYDGICNAVSKIKGNAQPLLTVSCLCAGVASEFH